MSENFLDLSRHNDVLGDHTKFFIHSHDSVPKVIEHATGEAIYILDNSGNLRPIGDYYAKRIPENELPEPIALGYQYKFGPRQGPGSNMTFGMSLGAVPGKFEFGGVVTDPKPTG